MAADGNITKDIIYDALALPANWGQLLANVALIFDNSTVHYAAAFLDSALITVFSLAVKYSTAASVPHSVAAVLQNLLGITGVTFKQAEKIKACLADPSKFAAAAAPSGG